MTMPAAQDAAMAITFQPRGRSHERRWIDSEGAAGSSPVRQLDYLGIHSPQQCIDIVPAIGVDSAEA